MDGNVTGVTAPEDLIRHTRGRAHDSLEYVPVIFAHDIERAEEIREALEDCGIPTLVEFDRTQSSPLSALTRRVPVLVPAEMLDESSERVARLEQGPVAGFDDDDEDDEDDEDDDDDEDEEEDDEEDEDF